MQCEALCAITATSLKNYKRGERCPNHATHSCGGKQVCWTHMRKEKDGMPTAYIGVTPFAKMSGI